jgi:hypothetical protein
MSNNTGYNDDNSGPFYFDKPNRGEFPAPNERYSNGLISGHNGVPCPMNLNTGYDISCMDTDYDWSRLYPAETVDSYYMVLNLQHPLNQTPYEVYSVSGTNVVQVDANEPWNNPQNRFMRQLFDFDIAEYCGERAPHNPPESDPCAPVQRTLNWFKP